MTTTAAYAVSSELPATLAQGIVNQWEESILVLDHDLIITFANQFFCSWIGVEWSTLASRPLQEFLGSKEISDFLRGVQGGSASRNVQANCSIPGIGKRSLLVGANRLLRSEQQALLLSVQDITNQNLSRSAMSRRVEVAEQSDQLQRKEAELLRSVMESSGDGIFVSDARGNCVLWNQACEEMLGLKPESVNHLSQGQWSEDFEAYLDDKETPFPVKDLPLSRALKGECSKNVELWVRNKTRPHGLWISVNASPLTRGQDGAISTFRDITFSKHVKDELAAQAEEVARSNRELEQFAYVAAHVLQEPLRMVSSLCATVGQAL